MEVSRFWPCSAGNTFGIFALTASTAVEKSNNGQRRLCIDDGTEAFSLPRLLLSLARATPEAEEDRTDQDERRRSKDCRRCSSGAALSGSPQQYRGRTGASGRDPDEQRRLLPGVGLPEADPSLRTAAPQDLRGRGRHHPHGQDRQSGDDQDLPARPTKRSAT